MSKKITAASARRLSRVLTARHGIPEGGDVSSDMWGTYWSHAWRDRGGSRDVFTPEGRVYSMSITEKHGSRHYRVTVFPAVNPYNNWIAA